MIPPTVVMEVKFKYTDQNRFVLMFIFALKLGILTYSESVVSFSDLKPVPSGQSRNCICCYFWLALTQK